MGNYDLKIAKKNVVKLKIKPCKELWEEVQKETDLIANKSNDPRIRNVWISSAYARLFVENREFEWCGLAAMASKTVGCAMRTASRAQWLAVGEDDKIAKDTVEGLGHGNKLLFRDIYPQYLFYRKHGLSRFLKCADSRELDGKLWPVSEEVKNAFKHTAKGEHSLATTLIARHEQLNILQKYMYNNAIYAKPIKLNREGINTKGFPTNWKEIKFTIGKFLTFIEELQFSFASNCESKNRVVFKDAVLKELPNIKEADLNIIDKTQRMAFVKVLQNHYEKLLKNENNKIINVIGTIKEHPIMLEKVYGRVVL